MYEERTTHIELNTHQSSLKINLLLLSRTFFPVDIAYKRLTTMFSIDTARFQGDVSDFF